MNSEKLPIPILVTTGITSTGIAVDIDGGQAQLTWNDVNSYFTAGVQSNQKRILSYTTTPDSEYTGSVPYIDDEGNIQVSTSLYYNDSSNELTLPKVVCNKLNNVQIISSDPYGASPTLIMGGGKTFRVNNTLTINSDDNAILTIPTTSLSSVIVLSDSTQTLSNKTIETPAISGPITSSGVNESISLEPNGQGVVEIGGQNTTISTKSSSTTPLTISTASDSGANIILSPDTGGKVRILSDLDVQGEITSISYVNQTLNANMFIISDNNTNPPIVTKSGVQVYRGGVLADYQIVFDEQDDSFKTGFIGSLKKVGHREDNPVDTTIPYWDNTSQMYKSSTSFKYSSGTGTLSVNNINGLVMGTTSGSSFSMSNNKSFNVSNSITLASQGDGNTYTLPGSSDVIVGLTSTQTLTNKVLTSPILTTPNLGVATATSINNLAITGGSGSSLNISSGKTFSVSNTIGLSGTDSTLFTLPSISGNIITDNASQTLTNKTLTLPIVTINDSSLVIQNSTTQSKRIAFNLSGISTSTTRTFIFPDVSDTLVTLGASQTLTNKTLTSPILNSPTINAANIGAATISSINGLVVTSTSSAALTVGSGKTLGVVSSLTINGANNGSGVLSDGYTYDFPIPSPSGSPYTFLSSSREYLVGVSASQVLSNKTLVSPVFSGTISFTTPSLGAATATSINGMQIIPTSVSTPSTLSITANKTFSVTNSINLASQSDGLTYTFPNTSSGVVVLSTSSQGLSNKTIESSSINIVDNVFTLKSNTNGNNTARLLLSNLPPGTNVSSYLLPNIGTGSMSDTLVGVVSTQTLTNKTLVSPIITGTLTLPSNINLSTVNGLSVVSTSSSSLNVKANKSVTFNNTFSYSSDNDSRVMNIYGSSLAFNAGSINTLNNYSNTGVSTINYPLGINDTVAFLFSTQTLSNKTLVTPVVQLGMTFSSGNLDVGSGTVTASKYNGVSLSVSGIATNTSMVIAGGKTFTINNSITLSSAIENGVYILPSPSSSSTDTLVSLTASQVLSNKTLTSPVLNTPSLGVATATSINNLSINNLTNYGTSSSSLNVANGKTVTMNNTLKFTGIDGSTINFPSSNDNVVMELASQTLRNKTLVEPILTTPNLGNAVASSINNCYLRTIGGSGSLGGVQATLSVQKNKSVSLTGASFTLNSVAQENSVYVLPSLVTPGGIISQDSLVTTNSTQTLSNKTLNAPVLVNATIGSFSTDSATIGTVNNIALNSTGGSSTSNINIGSGRTVNFINSVSLGAVVDGQTFLFPSSNNDTVITQSASQSLSNKFLVDNSVIFMNSLDNSKRILFNLASISTGTTRSYTLPDVSDTIVTLGASQVLTNKTLTSPVLNSPVLTTPSLGAATATSINGVAITSSAGGVLTIAPGKTFTANNTFSLTTDGGVDSLSFTLPGSSDTLVSLSASQVLSNKTMYDNSFYVRNNLDSTKRFVFNAGGISSGVLRTFTLPDISDTLVSLSASQVLSNKTLVSPVFSSDISVGSSYSFSSSFIKSVSGLNNQTINASADIRLVPGGLMSSAESSITNESNSNSVIIGGAGNLSSVGDMTIKPSSGSGSGNVNIVGNLNVSGTLTTISTEQIDVDTNMLLLNTNNTESPQQVQSGLEIYRGGVEENYRIIYDETSTLFKSGYVNSLYAVSHREDIPINGSIGYWSEDDSNGNGKFLTTSGLKYSAGQIGVLDGQPNVTSPAVNGISLGLVSGNSIASLAIVGGKTLNIYNTISLYSSGDVDGLSVTIPSLPGNSDTLVSVNSTQEIYNKTLDASTTLLADSTDNTKLAKFNLGSISTETTRTYTLPNVSDTLVSLTASQVLSNKTLVSPVLNTPSLGVASATSINGLTVSSTTGGVITINSSKTLAITNTITLGSAADGITYTLPQPSSGTTENIVGTSSTQTLLNKTLTSPVINILDNAFTLKNSSDTTKLAKFDLSSLNTSTTNTFILPTVNNTGELDVNSDTIVLQNTAMTLYDKTIDSATFTGNSTFTSVFLGVANADSINGLIISDTSESTLTVSSGKDVEFSNSMSLEVLGDVDGNTYTFPGTSDNIVGTSSTQTLTNKTLVSPVFSGDIAFSTSSIGTATASSINSIVLGVTGEGISLANLSVARGKSVLFNNSLTISGTDGITLNYPSDNVSDTLVTLNATQTLANKTIVSPVFSGTVSFTTPSLGAATASSVNSVSLGVSGSGESTGNLVLVRGKTLTVNKSITLESVDDSVTITYPGSSDTLVTENTSQTLTNKTLTSPVLNTPSLGAATATSINGMVITSSVGGVLTILSGKTLEINNSLTFTGTDGTSFALPSTSDTLVTLGASQVLTNKTLTTPTINVNANSLSIRDATDTTKVVKFVCSSLSTGTTRSYTLPDISDTLVTLTASQALTNKTLTSPVINIPTIVVNANVLSIRDNIDTTKIVQFDCSSVSSSTTRTLTIPDISDTLVGLVSSQVLTNKTLTSPVINTPSIVVNADSLSIRDSFDTSKVVQFDCSSVSTGTTRTLTIPNSSDTLVGLVSSQILTNKTLTSPVINTPSIVVNADSLSIRDATDTTKVVRFVCSSVSTSTTRSYTLPDVSDTLVTLGASQVLTNKTLTSPIINSPTINNANITIASTIFSDGGFAINSGSDTTKKIMFNVGSVPASTTRTLTIPSLNDNDTIVTLTSNATLTNKTLTSPNINGGGILYPTLTINADAFQINSSSDSTKTGTFSVENVTPGGTVTLSFPSGDFDDTIATLFATQTLQNKTLSSPTINFATISSPTISSGTITSSTITTPTIVVNANVLSIRDNSDTTKIAKFICSGISTGTTRSYTLPNVSDTLVTLDASQTLTNKSLTSPNIYAPSIIVNANDFIIRDNTNTSKMARFLCSSISAGTGRDYTLPDISDTLVTLTSTQVLTNKTLTSPTFTGNSTGSIIPNVDNTDTLGSALKAWSDVYGKNAYTTTSDQREKIDILPLDTRKMYDIALGLKPISYYWLRDYVSMSGNLCYHRDNIKFGYIAQDVEKVYTSLGLSENDIIVKSEDGKYRMRYEHLIPVMNGAIQHLDKKINCKDQVDEILKETDYHLDNDSNNDSNVTIALAKYTKKLYEKNKLLEERLNKIEKALGLQ